ncbi:MAG TPA: multidrug efflux SMR transporter [Hyphomicrobiaceae bacterium]|jgi:quaternary ammonium compound-resistance protein SugE|nr:multidrug efflux SMR transporter [Hyphomicrobiaceae bacterium]
MAWLLLVLAGAFEVGFTTSLKYAQGFTRLWPTLAFAVCVVLSMVLLERAQQTIPLGTAYAVWTGIGAAGTVVVGAMLFAEPLSALRILFLATLIGSIIGLKLFT